MQKHPQKFGGMGKLLYLCNTRIRHASRRPAYQGGTFILYSYMNYTNPPLDTPQLIASLRERGLTILDEGKAVKFLEDVSYFRFAAYLRPLEIGNDDKHFKKDTTIEQAMALYEFDAELRMLLFSAIQRIEISLRSKVINKFSLAHGAFWYMNPEIATDKHKYVENLSSLERELQRSKDDFIKEHHAKYGSNTLPPSWKLIDLTSFGCLTKLFFNFSDGALKKKVARSYGIPQQEILESWMKAINALRNTCAHHGRVWNRIMPTMPQMPVTLKKPWIKSRMQVANKLYPVLCSIIYWLNAIDSDNTLTYDFKALLKRYPIVDAAAMGFPAGWQDEELWTK